MLKLIYVTLETNEQAVAISQDLLEQQVAACTNWFPIQSMYRWQGKIIHGNEVVMIVKTTVDHHQLVCNIVARHIDSTNCIAELATDQVNQPYLDWLVSEVK